MTRFTNIGRTSRPAPKVFSSSTGRKPFSRGSGAGASSDGPRTHKAGRTPLQDQKAQYRAETSEKRRLKRVDGRAADVVCYACRGKGHTARDCPNSKEQSTEGSNISKLSQPLTGICYRCGSTKHRLSGCKKPEDPENPLPFASCFICSGTGHIASKCPKNENGVYPNGGCCRLCGEKTHLIKDCPVRQKGRDVKDGKLIFDPTTATDLKAGADEDDFHAVRRLRKEVEDEEVDRQRFQRLNDAAEKATQKAPAIVKPAVKLKKSKVVKF